MSNLLVRYKKMLLSKLKIGFQKDPTYSTRSVVSVFPIRIFVSYSSLWNLSGEFTKSLF